MSATELLSRLTARGITLRAVDDRIQAKPMSALRPDDREQLHQFKTDLLTLLRGDEPPDEILNHDERQRLMTETVERLSRQYQGQVIDWSKAHTINAKIGETFSRRELMMLRQQYEAAISGHPCH